MNLLRDLADRFARWAFTVDPGTWPHTWLVHLGAMVVVAVLVLTFVALFAGPLSWLERRIAGRIQARVGPNRVGPQGAAQWLADGLKCFLKEDLIPDAADGPLFRMGPYLVFVGTFGAFLVLPFGAHVVAAQLDVGLLYVFAITSLVVVGLLMSGWGSNSKWALFGGVRSAAQLVSYEVPAAVALMTVMLQAGTLSTQAIVGAQGGLPWQWFLLKNPFLFAAFFLYFTAAIAEGNRTPFDLPEAESELVSGYNTEYSGMRFLFFFFAEWANLWTMSAIATLAFLGGWQLPGVTPAEIAASTGLAFAGWQLLSFVVFAVKASALVSAAVIAHLQGQRSLAHQYLESALTAAVPEGIARPFVADADDDSLQELLTEHAVWGTSHEGFLAVQISSGDVGTSRHHHVGASLSPRERDIFGYLRTTMTADEIAAALHVSVNTVRTHQRAIYRKLGVSSRREAIRVRV